jgi:hypothetical protein
MDQTSIRTAIGTWNIVHYAVFQKMNFANGTIRAPNTKLQNGGI